MPRLAIALAATLALVACGGGAPASPDAGPDAAVAVETDCGDALDGDLDGKTDCDDPDCTQFLECKPVEPPDCARQRDCGDIVNEVVTNCCLSGKCVPPGPKTLKNEPETAQIYFDLTFNAPLTNPSTPRPQSMVVRMVYPLKLDGSPLTCTDVIGKLSSGTKNCVDETTRAVLDSNASVNQVFRMVYPLDGGSWGGTVVQFPNIFADVPKGQDYILYGEAWYGVRELNNPTGNCASLFCIEGKSVASNSQHFVLTFPDPNHPN